MDRQKAKLCDELEVILITFGFHSDGSLVLQHVNGNIIRYQPPWPLLAH
jgi:hypothetical protein